MKYIVYKTTNLVNNYIYIGVHHTNDDLKFDYYLGYGIDIRKPNSYEKAKTKFQQAVKEFGPSNFRRETIAVFDNMEDAYELERTLVNEEFLSRKDVYNMLLGGRPNPGNGITVFQYDINGNYLNTYKSYEEAGKAINRDPSTIRKAIMFKLRVCEQFYFNTDKMEKIDLSLYNNCINKTKVYRYLKTGEYDCEFESYGQAGKNSNSSPSNIRSGCMLGYCVKDMYYFSTIKADSFDKARTQQILTRPVYKYDSSGNFLEEYESQYLAEDANPGSNITKSIKLKSICYNGFIWGLEKLENYNSKGKSKNSKKKVGKFDDDGNLLQEWESMRQCSKEVGVGVQNVLTGKYQKHKGFIYKYIE